MKIVLAILFVYISYAQAGTLSQSYISKVAENINHISSVKLKKMLDKDEDFYLIDIRENAQIEHGEIYHSDLIQITRGTLEIKIEEFIKDKNKKIIVYCCSGNRSTLATKALENMGYTNVQSLDGGVKKWLEDGNPLDTIYGEMYLR